MSTVPSPLPPITEPEVPPADPVMKPSASTNAPQLPPAENAAKPVKLMKSPKALKKLRKAPPKKKPVPAKKKPAVPTLASLKSGAKLEKPNDLNNRIERLVGTTQKLKHKSERATQELAHLRDEQSHVELERDRLQQNWQLARVELKKERTVGRELERLTHTMKTRHAEQIQLLQQRVRGLLISGKTNRIATTQTEPIIEGGQVESHAVQTVEEIGREKAAELLRANDRALTRFIADLEKEKLAAQTELKYAVVQLEAKLNDEHDTALRRLREEKEQQLEEIARLHQAQLIAFEEEREEERSKNRQQISYFQGEILQLTEQNSALLRNLEMAESKAEEVLHFNQEQSAVAHKEHEELLQLRQKLHAQTSEQNRVERLERELAKLRDLNEIILGDFRKVEKERNELLESFESSVQRISSLSRRRKEATDSRINSLFPKTIADQ